MSGDFRRHVPETSIACVAPGQVRLRCRCMWLWYGLGSGDGLPVAVVWPCPWLCLWCPVTVTVAVAVCACGGARARVCVCVSLVCVPLRPRVCMRTGIRLRLRLRGCLGRVRRCACRVSCPASAANSWPCARRSRGACAVWAMSHTRASRNLDFGFEVRGERQARVPVAAPAILSFSMRVLCVFIDLLRSPSLRRDGVDCACGCARYIVFLYVCLLTY